MSALRHVLFWLCCLVALAYAAVGAWLAVEGVKAWPALVMGAYFLGCAYLQARSAPAKRPRR